MWSRSWRRHESVWAWTELAPAGSWAAFTLRLRLQTDETVCQGASVARGDWPLFCGLDLRQTPRSDSPLRCGRIPRRSWSPGIFPNRDLLAGARAWRL
jgi:hypothetical protein